MLDNMDAIAGILSNVDHACISSAMRDLAEAFGEPSYRLMCGDEQYACSCGANCGEDDDCFACGEKDNLRIIRFGEMPDADTH